MNDFLPLANIVTGILVCIVGFVFHFIGQLISLVNWDLATRIGIAEKGMPAEYKVYEKGMAVADVALAWSYGVIGVGLILGSEWGVKLAWIPGTVLVYHAISFWFWSGYQEDAGHHLRSKALRIGWSVANLVTGVLSILIAWIGY